VLKPFVCSLLCCILFFSFFLLPVPVHSLPVSSLLSITISIDQLQQDQNFVLKLLVCRSGSPRRPRRKPLQAVRESDEWEGTVTQSVYSKFSKTCIKGGSTGSADTAEGVKKRACGKTTANASASCNLPRSSGRSNRKRRSGGAFVEYILFTTCVRPWFVTF